MAEDAFDLAEQFQTLVFVMSDLDLGMNNWMSDPFKYPETPINRGKVLSKEDLDKLGSFARYKDVDGDGIGYRTLPGHRSSCGGLFHARQRTQREVAVQRAARRLRTQHGAHQPQVRDGALVCPATGSRFSARARRSASSPTELRTGRLIESRDQLRKEYKFETDYLRLRAYPFTREVHDFIEKHDRVYVVEQNRDAQMLSLLKLDLRPELITRLRSIAHIHGLPLDARSVTDEIMTMEGK